MKYSFRTTKSFLEEYSHLYSEEDVGVLGLPETVEEQREVVVVVEGLQGHLGNSHHAALAPPICPTQPSS